MSTDLCVTPFDSTVCGIQSLVIFCKALSTRSWADTNEMGLEVMEGLRFLASLPLAWTRQREGGGFSCINKRIISHPVTVRIWWISYRKWTNGPNSLHWPVRPVNPFSVGHLLYPHCTSSNCWQNYPLLGPKKRFPYTTQLFSLGVGMCNQGAAMDIRLIRSRTRHVPVTSAKDSILEASTLRYYH